MAFVLTFAAGFAYAQSQPTITLTCDPMIATSNSIRTYTAVWTDADGIMPEPVLGRRGGFLVLRGIGTGDPTLGGIPMYYIEGEPVGGAIFKVTVSAGLNMSSSRQWPRTYINPPYTASAPSPARQSDYIPRGENRVLWDDYGRPIWYASSLRDSETDWNVATAVGYKSALEETPLVVSNDGVPLSVTVVRARHNNSTPESEMIDYGTSSGSSDPFLVYGLDRLTSYPGLDPLDVVPYDRLDTANPDVGSGNHSYKFSVRYTNAQGLLPSPWFTWRKNVFTKTYSAKLESVTWPTTVADTGVVLYIDRADTGDYQVFPMYLESGDPANGIYTTEFTPNTLNAYTSLPLGTYHYFFGASDDNLIQPQYRETKVLEHQPIPLEWGNYMSSVDNFADAFHDYFDAATGGWIQWWTGSLHKFGRHYFLPDPNFDSYPSDPSYQRVIGGYPEIDRPVHRRYSAESGSNVDHTLLVDRRTDAPGFFDSASYPYKSSEFPKVTCGLTMEGEAGNFRDVSGIAYDDTNYGLGQFWGTLQPFYRAINPDVSAYTSGATTKTENVFRIMYKQMDGKAPVKMQVWISESFDGTAAKAYTMTPDPDRYSGAITGAQYKKGVWYVYKKALNSGPHSYYFTANDGETEAYWPYRPNNDPYVPGANNDYVPGPYVNNAPELSSPSVTPQTGKQGQTFTYRVTYKDADGQRPYSSFLYIETNSKGNLRKCLMRPVTPLDPTADNRDAYKAGVEYYFDTGTLEDGVLETGDRRFRFEFVDDWGTQTDTSDYVAGEPAVQKWDGGSWLPGPVITGNTAPTLANGSVRSTDGTSNEASLWSFRVTYRDLDNDAPSVVKVFIGQLQPDGKTVLWDQGHPMQQTDPTDTVYNDGAGFYYQTRLSGPSGAGMAGTQYYYSFLAYDGHAMATYRSSSDERVRSDAAFAYELQPLDRIDANNFRFVPVIAQQGTASADGKQVTPRTAGDILSVAGVYLNEDLTGTNYYIPAMASPTFTPGDSTIVLTQTLTAGSGSVWISYEPRAPIMGPVLLEEISTGPGVIADANVFVEAASGQRSGRLTDDQKSGWQKPDDLRYSVMTAAAVDVNDNPSTIVIRPDNAGMIGSVEGVFTSSDLSGTNYCNPNANTPQMVQLGAVDAADPDRLTVVPSDHKQIAHVTGVFGNSSLSGSNFLAPGTDMSADYKITLGGAPPSGINTVYIAYQPGLAQAGSVDSLDVTRKTVVPSYAVQISQVLGVFDNAELTGTNYMGGQMNVAKKIPLAISMPADKTPYIKYQWFETMTGTTVFDAADSDPYYVNPQNPERIGKVLGVYTNSSLSGVNYLKGDLNNRGRIPLTADPGSSLVYVKYLRTGFVVGNTTVRLTTQLPDEMAGGTVYVKYADIRFTHLMRGTSSGDVRYTPDSDARSRIKGNIMDATGGVLGVWLKSNREGENYFDPRRAFITDGPSSFDVTKRLPAGTSTLWSRFYQKGDYWIDRWNRNLEFFYPVVSTDVVKSTYLFGMRVPTTIVGNTPPILSDGKVTPTKGGLTTDYEYSVVYRDNDGPNGQAPLYVTVYIDGAAYEMTSASGATPVYREGALYKYTAKGLSSGAHKFYFAASDGADVTVFDYYTLNKLPRPTTGSTIRDLDGPWTNERPTLSEGQVVPNPTAGITISDSVDFLVKYTDRDNDEPYFFDPSKDIDDKGLPVGADKSGSPRLFLDSDKSTIVSGVVRSLEDDLVVAGRVRTIVALDSLGRDPGWVSDEFAGKLLQITNGAVSGRVYLIQSNTRNRLILATDNLRTDGVTPQDKITDAKTQSASQFIINGLLMSKADPSQYNYRDGIVYKITVPKLGVIRDSLGAISEHAFRFEARSRENKPAWLNDFIPYSDPVVALSGDGPKVVLPTIEDNTAPVLSQVGAGPLYAGPRVQEVKRLSSLKVGPLSAATFAEIKEVLGVYVNANRDAHLPTPVSYYNPETASKVFAEGDPDITLTTALPALSDGDLLVQLGSTGESLSQVLPDRPDVIKTVTGVYLTENLSGTNYFDPVSGVYSGGVVNLTTPIPSRSDKIYVQYELSGGGDWPAYAEYFAKYSSATVFLAGEPLTFRVAYSDAESDPPSYHDSVDGFIRVVFDDASNRSPMIPLKPPVSDFSTVVPFTATLTDVPEGTHQYHFEASDGYYTVRYPTSSGLDWTVRVNYKPVIRAVNVDPINGRGITKFTFTATYQDRDGVAPPPGSVVVRLTKKDDAAIQKVYVLDVDPSETTRDYSRGVKLVGYSNPDDPLPAGTYKVLFEARDAYQDADPVLGPEIGTREANVPPEILSYSVTPLTGKRATVFTYSAIYRDADNDAPVAITASGERVRGLSLIIDGKTSAPRILTTAVTNPVYTAAAGVLFEVRLNGSDIGIGNHTFSIRASDGTEEAPKADGTGPLLLVPFFDSFRVVTKGNPADRAGITQAGIGERVLVRGILKLPFNSVTPAPTAISNGITILVKKPDGSSVSVLASVSAFTVERDSLGNPLYWSGDIVADYANAQPRGDAALVTGDSLSLVSNGNWEVSASWPGDADWDTGDSPVVIVSVGGIMRTVAVEDPLYPDASRPLVDMITPPTYIGSPDYADVGLVFSYDRAVDMQIVRWDPASKTYLQFGVVGSFVIAPGEALWIRPKTSYPADRINKVDIDNGWLATGDPSSPWDLTKTYRLIIVSGKDYPVVKDSTGKPIIDPTTGTAQLEQCVVPLKAGWNQFGNIFFNWKRDSSGNQITPREDVGIPLSQASVTYLGMTKSLTEAALAGWIRDYAWRWDAIEHKYVLVHPSVRGAENVLKAWSGYWIRALVDCSIIIDPNTAYNGDVETMSLSLPAYHSVESAAAAGFDAPPAPIR